MSKTNIEWTEYSWNPVSGCTPISEGCQNCYAKRMSKRLAGRCGYPADDPFRVTLHPKRLDEPLKWKKPRRVFVCSMGDLFHEDVPNEFIDEAFGVMLALKIFANCANHTFLVLTKRPERMLKYLTDRTPIELLKAWANACPWSPKDGDLITEDVLYSACCRDWDENGRNSSGSKHKPWGYIHKFWPLPNVWLGTTAENQEQADKRIPVLLQIPAAVRFVSVEPMLGPVDLTRIDLGCNTWVNALIGNWKSYHPYGGLKTVHESWGKLDWVICGGETGPGARPMHPDWVRSLVLQCKNAGVPIFVKQMGSVWAKAHSSDRASNRPEEWPEDLRIRELPPSRNCSLTP